MTCVRCGGFVIIDRYAWPGKEIDSREVLQAQLRLGRGSRDASEPQAHGDGDAPSSECPSDCAWPNGVFGLKAWIGRSGRSWS